MFLFTGKRIKVLREGMRLTQEELAERVHLSRSALANYESGMREPKGEILVRLADVLQTTTDYLLGRVGVSSLPYYGPSAPPAAGPLDLDHVQLAASRPAELAQAAGYPAGAAPAPADDNDAARHRELRKIVEDVLREVMEKESWTIFNKK